MVKKVHKLIFEPDYEFFLLGISSSENDYKLSWIINSALNLKLNRQEDVEIHNPKSPGSLFFTRYSFQDEDQFIDYILVSNRCDCGFLVEEYKNLDFFLKISGELNENLTNSVYQTLKDQEDIIMVTKLNPLDMKSKQKLIF